MLSVFFTRFEVSQVATPTELMHLATLAISSLKSNRTRERTALTKEEAEANSLLQRDLELNEEREVDRYLLSISRVILNLEAKLARLEAANEKLADALEQSEDTLSAEEFQSTLADADGSLLMELLTEFHN